MPSWKLSMRSESISRFFPPKSTTTFGAFSLGVGMSFESAPSRTIVIGARVYTQPLRHWNVVPCSPTVRTMTSHCMSPRASKEHKVQTAFRLYDFDNNGYLDRQDVYMLLKLLSTTPKKKELLENDECNDVAERVMRDCDMDGNQRISYAEFSKVVNRIPDFVTNFRLYIQ